jgi:hypothetical protein
MAPVAKSHEASEKTCKLFPDAQEADAEAPPNFGGPKKYALDKS